MAIAIYNYSSVIAMHMSLLATIVVYTYITIVASIVCSYIE